MSHESLSQVGQKGAHHQKVQDRKAEAESPEADIFAAPSPQLPASADMALLHEAALCQVDFKAARYEVQEHGEHGNEGVP